jgi:hypothetical protein
MQLKLVILCGGAMLLISTTVASAEGPSALTNLELDVVTVPRSAPDQLRRLRIILEDVTDDDPRLSDEVIAETLDTDSPPPRIVTDVQRTAVAATPGGAGAVSDRWTERQSAPAVTATPPTVHPTASGTAWTSRPNSGRAAPQWSSSRNRSAVDSAAPDPRRSIAQLRSGEPRMMRIPANRGFGVRPRGRLESF